MTAVASCCAGPSARLAACAPRVPAFSAARPAQPWLAAGSAQPCGAQAGARRLGSTHVARASPDDKDEELPWERREKLQKLADSEGKELPFGVYLLGSAIITIAAVGSIFEIVNRNPIFGVLPPSNPLWLPILGFFAVTGIPSAGFLFFKSINAANAAADRQNKIDGY